MKLTLRRLKERVHYNPETGQFTNLIEKRGPNGAVGSILGAYRQGYLSFNLDGVRYKAHRLAVFYMTGKMPPAHLVVNHINGDGTDNRWCNLEVVTHQENMRHQKLRPDNKWGIRGVYWDKFTRSFKAQIISEQKAIHLGSNLTLFEACARRLKAEQEMGYKTLTHQTSEQVSVFRNDFIQRS